MSVQYSDQGETESEIVMCSPNQLNSFVGQVQTF